VALEHGGRSSWLEELYVEPVARDGAIGTLLLEQRFAWRPKRRVAVDLEVDADHQRVAGYTPANGFHPCLARWVRSLEPVATRRPVAPAEIVGLLLRRDPLTG